MLGYERGIGRCLLYSLVFPVVTSRPPSSLMPNWTTGPLKRALLLHCSLLTVAIMHWAVCIYHFSYCQSWRFLTFFPAVMLCSTLPQAPISGKHILSFCINKVIYPLQNRLFKHTIFRLHFLLSFQHFFYSTCTPNNCWTPQGCSHCSYSFFRITLSPHPYFLYLTYILCSTLKLDAG